jgi:hypothetical protein
MYSGLLLDADSAVVTVILFTPKSKRKVVADAREKEKKKKKIKLGYKETEFDLLFIHAWSVYHVCVYRHCASNKRKKQV